MPMTRWSSVGRTSSRLEPMKPATPVTTHVGLCGRSDESCKGAFQKAGDGNRLFLQRKPRIIIERAQSGDSEVEQVQHDTRLAGACPTRPAAEALIVASPSPEGAMLLLCSRTVMSTEQAARLERLGAGAVDWKAVVALAAKHRLLPLLHRNLTTFCPDAMPASAARSLAARVAANAETSGMLRQEAAHLCNLLIAAGVAVMAFKGPPLAATVYGDVSLRQSWDIDLLVAEPDVARVASLLAEEGYVPGQAFDRAQDFVNPLKGITVDVHWALTPWFFPVNVDVRELLSRQRLVAVDGVPIPVPCDDDMLFILCLQAAKDCWERRQHLEYLSKAVDIAEFLRATPYFDWSRVKAEARRSGCLRILHFGLAVASDLLGAQLPRDVRADVQADATAARLAADVCHRLFTPEDMTGFRLASAPFTVSHRFRQLRFYLSMRERPVDWGMHVFEIGRTGVPRLVSTWMRSMPSTHSG